jgi:hypothetical protein
MLPSNVHAGFVVLYRIGLGRHLVIDNCIIMEVDTAMLDAQMTVQTEQGY